MKRTKNDGIRRLVNLDLFKAFRPNCLRLPGPEDTIPDLADLPATIREFQRPKAFFTSQMYLRQYDRADYQGAPYEIRLFTWRYMRALRNRGLPFFVHTCYRSPEEQKRLKALGHSQVTSGAHQRSCAVDIVHAVHDWRIPKELWYYVGTLGEQVARQLHLGRDERDQVIKIEWGGRWDFYDPAHWQINNWKQRPIIQPEEPFRASPYSDKLRFG